jgi:hypothetical protein
MKRLKKFAEKSAWQGFLASFELDTIPLDTRISMSVRDASSASQTFTIMLAYAKVHVGRDPQVVTI